MIKQIELKDKFGLYKGKEPYILAYNDSLSLEFLCDFKNCKMVARLDNGEKNATIILKDNKLEVPIKLIFKGILNGYVKIYKNGQEINKFLLEDLIIDELATEKYVIPQIEILKSENAEFKADLTAKYDALKSQSDLITKLVYSICEIEPKESKND